MKPLRKLAPYRKPTSKEMQVGTSARTKFFSSRTPGQNISESEIYDGDILHNISITKLKGMTKRVGVARFVIDPHGKIHAGSAHQYIHDNIYDSHAHHGTYQGSTYGFIHHEPTKDNYNYYSYNVGDKKPPHDQILDKMEKLYHINRVSKSKIPRVTEIGDLGESMITGNDKMVNHPTEIKTKLKDSLEKSGVRFAGNETGHIAAGDAFYFTHRKLRNSLPQNDIENGVEGYIMHKDGEYHYDAYDSLRGKPASPDHPALKRLQKFGINPHEHQSGRHWREDINEGENDYLYHATFQPYMKSIMKAGIHGNSKKKNYSDSESGKVYLDKSAAGARAYAETSETVPDKYLDNIKVLKVHKKNINNNLLYKDKNVQGSNNSFEYHGKISPEHVEIHENINEWVERKPHFNIGINSLKNIAKASGSNTARFSIENDKLHGGDSEYFNHDDLVPKWGDDPVVNGYITHNPETGEHHYSAYTNNGQGRFVRATHPLLDKMKEHGVKEGMYKNILGIVRPFKGHENTSSDFRVDEETPFHTDPHKKLRSVVKKKSNIDPNCYDYELPLSEHEDFFNKSKIAVNTGVDQIKKIAKNSSGHQARFVVTPNGKLHGGDAYNYSHMDISDAAGETDDRNPVEGYIYHHPYEDGDYTYEAFHGDGGHTFRGHHPIFDEFHKHNVKRDTRYVDENLVEASSIFDFHYPHEEITTKRIGKNSTHTYQFKSPHDTYHVTIDNIQHKDGQKHAHVMMDSRRGGYTTSGAEPQSAHKVFGTLMHIQDEHAKKHNIDTVHFTAAQGDKESVARNRLYSHMWGDRPNFKTEDMPDTKLFQYDTKKSLTEAEDVHILTHGVNKFPVLKNPDRRDVIDLHKDVGPYGEIRTLKHGNDLYAWDANHSTHQTVKDQLLISKYANTEHGYFNAKHLRGNHFDIDKTHKNNIDYPVDPVDEQVVTGGNQPYDSNKTIKAKTKFKQVISPLIDDGITENFESLPYHVKKRAQELFDNAHPDKVGTTEMVNNHHLETHTLGCMYYGDVPEEDAWDEHYKLYDHLKKHHAVFGDPSEGKFVSIANSRPVTEVSTGLLMKYITKASKSGMNKAYKLGQDSMERSSRSKDKLSTRIVRNRQKGIETATDKLGQRDFTYTPMKRLREIVTEGRVVRLDNDPTMKVFIDPTKEQAANIKDNTYRTMHDGKNLYMWGMQSSNLIHPDIQKHLGVNFGKSTRAFFKHSDLERNNFDALKTHHEFKVLAGQRAVTQKPWDKSSSHKHEDSEYYYNYYHPHNKD